jgi:hypothetical protein
MNYALIQMNYAIIHLDESYHDDLLNVACSHDKLFGKTLIIFL